MSEITLGQRQFPTLGVRSQQPKNYVGPTLSCYLGHAFAIYHVYMAVKIMIIQVRMQNCDIFLFLLVTCIVGTF